MKLSSHYVQCFQYLITFKLNIPSSAVGWELCSKATSLGFSLDSRWSHNGDFAKGTCSNATFPEWCMKQYVGARKRFLCEVAIDSRSIKHSLRKHSAWTNAVSKWRLTPLVTRYTPERVQMKVNWISL